MTDLSIEKFFELKEKLFHSSNILITMSKPDGDSIGSSLSIYKSLLKEDKTCRIISSFEIPDYLKFLPLIDKVELKDLGKLDFSLFDLIIIVDSSNSFRAVDTTLYGNNWDFPKESFVVSFDHHSSHDGNFADIDIFSSNISSSCELVYKFLKYANFFIDNESASLLFSGIYTDTGGFFYDNANSSTFTTISELLLLGADKNFILKNLNRPLNQESINLISKLLFNIEKIQEIGFSYFLLKITSDILESYPEKIIEEVLNLMKGNPGFIKNVKGIDFGIIVKENKGITQISFRERENKFDLTIVCKKYGGGGHPKACAYTVNKGLDEAIDELKDDLRKTYSQ